MRMLVTGSRGLLGSAVARQVIARGHECVVVQRNPSGIDGATEFLDDLTNPRLSDQWITGVDAVIHLAAKVGIAGSHAEFESANVNATRDLLSLAKSHGIRNFVFASSPSVAHTGKPLVGVGATPAQPLQVRGFYSQTKAIAEIDVLAAGDHGFHTTALRPHLVWGPGDTQLIGRIVDRARAGRLFLIGGGEALIDTCYVDNAATAFVLAAERTAEVAGRALMVTNGEPRTVKETLQRICQAAGVPEPTRSVPIRSAMMAGAVIERLWARRDSEPPLTTFLVEQLSTAHWFDISETKETLEWSPIVSLDEGFTQLANWFAQQP